MQENIEVDVNLNGNAIVNGALQNLSTPPVSPAIGQLYFDTSLGTAREWNGSAWRNLDAGTLTDGSIQNAALAPLTSSMISDLSSTLNTNAILNGTSQQTGANFCIDGRGTIAGGAMIGATNNTINSPGLVQGTDNTISGTHDFASGYNNNVTGNLAAAIGESNQSAGHQSFALGLNNNAQGDRSFALGVQATTNNPNSFVFGDGSIPAADSAPGQFVVQASGGLNFNADTSGNPILALSSGNATVNGALNVTGSSTLNGVLLNGQNAFGVVTLDGSGNITSVAPNTLGYVLTDNGPGVAPTFQAASGGGSGINNGTSLQSGASFNIDGSASSGTLNVANGVASNGSYVAIGSGTTATMHGAVAIGDGASATNTDAIAIGPGCNASGDYALALGSGANAHGTNSVAIGDLATAHNAGSFVLSSGDIAVADIAHGQFVARFVNGYTLYDDTTGTPALTLSGGNLAVTGNVTAANIGAASSQATPADPTGTVSETPVMMGLGASITPNAGNPVLVIVSGNFSGSSTNGAAQISFGTGSAPANGDAVTGTQAGGNVGYDTDSVVVPFSLNAVVTGLTAGTPYWVDVAVASDGTNETALSNVSISIVEL